MLEPLRAELRRLRAPMLLLGLLHVVALAVLARFMNPVLWPLPLLTAVGALYLVTGLLLAAWQWQAWLPLPRWIGLLHQPLPPVVCVAPLVGAGVALLALSVALPLMLAGPLLLAFGHAVAPLHVGLAALGGLVALSGYLGGMAACLGTGWGRWLSLLLAPMIWSILGARPLPELLGLGLLGCVLLGLLIVGRVRPARALPPAAPAWRLLEAALLLLPASWGVVAAAQLLGQGMLLLAERHPAVHPAGPAHFEHWRASKNAERLAALWPIEGFESWSAQPASEPVLHQLHPGEPLPERGAPGSERVAQLLLPDGQRVGYYDAQRRLYRLQDRRRQGRGWLGEGCPGALAESLIPLGLDLPRPVPGGLLIGPRLLVWQGDCLVGQLDNPAGTPLIDAQADARGSLALSATQLLWLPAGATAPQTMDLPRPLAPVQTLVIWSHPHETRWLLMLLEGRFMRPVPASIGLWSLAPQTPPKALLERPLAADFPPALLWSDTWAIPMSGPLQTLLGAPGATPPVSVLAVLAANALLSAAGAWFLSRRGRDRGGGRARPLPWMLFAAAAGLPALVVQHALQRRGPPAR